MITELEQEFFKRFNIKPTFRYIVQSELPIISTDRCRPVYDLTKKQFKNFALSRAKGYKLVEVVKIYPEITDRKLLEMICILNNYGKYDCWEVVVARLKDAILENCIEVVVDKLLNDDTLEQFKHKIQQLFKEAK